MLILTVHVDDMAVAGTGVEVDKLLVTLDTDLTTNDLGTYPSSQGVPSSRTLRMGCTQAKDVHRDPRKAL